MEPFNFTWDSKAGDDEHIGAGKDGEESHRHPITKVLGWRKRLESEEGLTKVQIGHEAGLTKSRITHMFMMLSLPKEAQEYLAALTSPQAIQYFSVRRLKVLAKLPLEEQREEFAVMQANCARRGY